MIRKNDKGIYQSTLFTQLGVVHGYSTRQFGDLRDGVSKDAYLRSLNRSPADVVIGQQVHGVKIARAGISDRGKVLSGIDALVTHDPQVLLGVTFADCVPLLAIDPKAYIIGVAHAGWKGTLAGVAGELIREMKTLGAAADATYISIGPHIGMCHYNVLPDRIMAFQKKFGDNPRITSKIGGSWYLDIGYANYQSLLDAGIRKDHIDAPPTCTQCQIADFHSYRGDTKETFGVQLAVISL